MFLGRLVIFLLSVFVQWYFYQAIRTVTKKSAERWRKLIRYTFLVIAGIIVLSTFISMFYSFQFWPRPIKVTLGSFMLIIILCQLIGIMFLIPDDIIRLFRWIYTKFIAREVREEGGTKISRVKFLSQLAVLSAAIPGAGFLYGFLKGGYDYRIHRVKISFPNLPDAFNGFKIVQISDIHTGSFMTTRPLQKAFDMIQKEAADIIFFTGDLVNDHHQETEGFEPVFSSLKAPHGVHSVFGNHDYGDYMFREEAQREQKLKAQEELKKVHARCGWNLLMNSHTYIEKNGQRIGLIGMENWDARSGFSKYGDMQKSINGMDDVPFKILLSHSPSHWDNEVSKKYKDIDLTLSGHTHGMQFGIDIPGFKWSPVQYIYRQWAGLYKSDNQYLYVNRGLGFIGYNGRLGIWPEITVIELHKGNPSYEEA